VLAIASTLIGHCNISIRRGVQSHNVLIAEHYANPALRMSAVTAAARRHTRRQLVHKIVIHGVSFT